MAPYVLLHKDKEALSLKIAQENNIKLMAALSPASSRTR